MKTYLEERIEWYDDNYRNGNALISDKQFDQLEKNLLKETGLNIAELAKIEGYKNCIN